MSNVFPRSMKASYPVAVRGEGCYIIARRQSYHGNTLGALAAGGNAWRRQMYDTILVESSHIAPCYAYREMREGESEAEFAVRT